MALAALIPCSAWAAGAPEPPACASTLDGLHALVGDGGFALRWEETSMRDGKPLVVTIGERQGSLFLEFVKTREGLWAESDGLICKAGAGLETRFGAGQVRLGPAAHWVLRIALKQGGKFTLTPTGPNQLLIATTGWSGVFAARPAK